MDNPKINPYFALIVGVLSVSTSAIFVKLSSADAAVIAFYRLFFSVVLMIPIFFPKYIKEVFLMNTKEWSFSIIAGIFLAFHFILWFESLNYTTVASSTVLVTLQPLFAFVGTFLLFNEKFSSKAILCAIIAIFGSVIISWGDFKISGSALYGDFLALAACAFITAYLLFGQEVRKRISLIAYTFTVYFISSIVLFIYVLFTGSRLYPYPSADWIYFLLLALIPTLLGHTLFNWSLKWLSTSTISMAILFEPVGAAILAVYILNESIIWTQIIGGLIIIISVTLFLFQEKKSKVVQSMESS
ncbi:DMT family transporter [Lederbergia wuyishanensis]|uniref:Drug/metabolite transporter (DMT)-like permease n=1 Tax=Lederbergia wuyishanensis TaxID=1347903 RepID=A0ABU0D959_9BACI|nr:DMT family transporter [Lederbergia wuyishanensis]MCJ8009483.1 DMT family transporter [Lederbergia wuyishanensis]MDQ0344907.1 drug/metabolite transporter (DMT)-like permease [Lederbergia wuyishanensis]